MKTDQNPKTLSERMAARQTEAREKITALLWQEGDPDEIAAVALANGLPPEDVDKIAMQVEKSQATLAAAALANKALPDTEKTLAEKQSEVSRLDAELATLQNAFDEAAQILSETEDAQREQNATINEAIRAAQRGEIPDNRAPKFIRDRAKAAAEQAAAAGRASRLAALQSGLRWRRNRLDGLQGELSALEKNDPEKHMQVQTPGGLVPARQVLESRIETELKEIKILEAEIKENEAAA